MRMDAHLTQRDLAARLKRPLNVISRIESAQRRVDLLEWVALCEACNADPVESGTQILKALVAGARAVNRVLMDRDFEAGDEPVKLCLRGAVPVELRKRVAPDLQYDTVGESVGFFRFDEAGARRLTEIVAGYVARGASDVPHEEAVRELGRLQPRMPLRLPADRSIPNTATSNSQRGASIRWSSGSVLALARNARPTTSRWISLVPSKMV